MIIDSKQFELSVNILSIDTFKPTKDNRLNIIYQVPDGQSTSKKNETYDTCELELMLKTYESIKHKLEATKNKNDEALISGGDYTSPNKSVHLA